MRTRTRLIIMAALLCHLLLGAPLVTSQTQPAKNADQKLQSRTQKLGIRPGEQATIYADQLERQGELYTLRGNVEMHFRGYIFRGEVVTFNRDTGDLEAHGNLIFDGGPHDEHLTATHGTYNVNTDNGTFFDVVGTTGAKFKGRTVVLTSSEPFAFSGKVVDKVGRDKLIIHHGTATACRVPHPKWSFHASRMIVVAGEDAHIYQSTFRLLGIPVFYFPYATHPVEHLGRHSGFLMPNLGQSSVKGTILGDSFFWAINRSMDATLGAEYFSNRGWAQHVDFRAKPSEASYIAARFFGVTDRGFPVPGTSVLQDQGGQDVRVTGEARFHGARAVADVNYLSSFLFRLAFAETFTAAINSEVTSTAFLSRDWSGFSVGTSLGRYQNFQSAQPGDLITIVHAPSFESSTGDRQIGDTPVYWSYDAALEGLSRREPTFVTANVVGRFDTAPRVTTPLIWHSWTVRPQIELENTFYTDRLVASPTTIGQTASNSVDRRALLSEVEIRPPALEKLFERPFLHHNLKHTFEPQAVYRRVVGVGNFANIIRFDARDILSDTNEIEYGFVNRIYAKRIPKGTQNCVALDRSDTSKEAETARAACDAAPAREVVTWEVAQKYFFDPTFGGALVNGRRNVFTTTAEFTGIAFLTEPRLFSPVVSRLRARAANADMEWHLDYDPRKGRISSSMAFVSYRFFKEFSVSGGHTFLQSPGEVVTSTPISTPLQFNQFRLLFQYGRPNKNGLNAAATLGYDVNQSFLQYSAYQTTYNWECCGLSFEYRRFALGQVRNENQFRFALTLANVGTFGTLRKQERLF